MINKLDYGDVTTAFLLCNNVIDLKKQDGKNLYRIDQNTIKTICENK